MRCTLQGLVVTPFLPGDSLLFAAGTLAAMGALSLPVLVGLLFTAAVLGDTLNYAVGALGDVSCRRACDVLPCFELTSLCHAGNWLGAKAFTQHSNIFKPDYLRKTEAFFDKYGAKTVRPLAATAPRRR